MLNPFWIDWKILVKIFMNVEGTTMLSSLEVSLL